VVEEITRRQDFNENMTSAPAITARPKKNIGPAAKRKSAIHQDNGRDTRDEIPGASRKNIVTKPLSLLVTVNAT
jgi:hypothetical protein